MTLKRFLAFSLVILLVSCWEVKQNSPLDAFTPLEGTWEMPFEGTSVFERWEKVNDTLMRGWSYEISDGDSVLTETIQIIATDSGTFYVPVVTEQNEGAPVFFKLTSRESDGWVFENPEHDFPTRIEYHFLSNDQLAAAVSGEVNGEMRSLEFNYRKVK